MSASFEGKFRLTTSAFSRFFDVSAQPISKQKIFHARKKASQNLRPRTSGIILKGNPLILFPPANIHELYKKGISCTVSSPMHLLTRIVFICYDTWTWTNGKIVAYKNRGRLLSRVRNFASTRTWLSLSYVFFTHRPSRCVLALLK